MRFMDAVSMKYKIVAGDVISLDAYRQKLKQADQKVRKTTKKDTIKAEPISDGALARFLRSWETETHSDLALFIDRALFDLAADYLSGSGALDPDNSDKPKLMSSILSRLSSYTSRRREADLREAFKNVEIWVSDSGEHFFFDTKECGEDDIEDGLKFFTGYDSNGKEYKDSVFKEKAG